MRHRYESMICCVEKYRQFKIKIYGRHKKFRHLMSIFFQVWIKLDIYTCWVLFHSLRSILYWRPTFLYQCSYLHQLKDLCRIMYDLLQYELTHRYHKLLPVPNNKSALLYLRLLLVIRRS